jgi:hypothetical protein
MIPDGNFSLHRKRSTGNCKQGGNKFLKIYFKNNSLFKAEVIMQHGVITYEK